MIEIQPPNRVSGHYLSWPSIFLAGSIEMDTAGRWQDIAKKDLSDLDCVIFNPRRDDWDNSIKQSLNDPRFSEQVNWELDHITNSDIVGFYFDPNTKSPITLMELGLITGLNANQEIVVCCPDGFWRKGNIEILCDRHNVPLVNNYLDFIYSLRDFVKRY